VRRVAREHAGALARLHELLLRAARFECARRRPTLPHLRGNDLDDIANQAADDALVSILGKLDTFRGARRPASAHTPARTSRSGRGPPPSSRTAGVWTGSAA